MWTVYPLCSILVNGHLENVFLVSGTDRRIHLYKKVVDNDKVRNLHTIWPMYVHIVDSCRTTACSKSDYMQSWKILGMLSCDCRDSSLNDQAHQQSLKTPMQRFACHRLHQIYNIVLYDRRNVTLEFWVIVGVLDRPKKNLYNQTTCSLSDWARHLIGNVCVSS